MFEWTWGIENEVFLQKTIERCREKKIILPRFSELKEPGTIPAAIQKKLEKIDVNAVHPLNLFRINWRNDPVTGRFGSINYFEIPREITGVRARIIGLPGKFFPTGAHKVGATYGCLAPYLITGKLDPDYHKAVWPSTGNYCRGGSFNSALLSIHAVAVLPEEMSRERFEWLNEIGAEVYATPGCESNVKEIYDKCKELQAGSDQYLVLNQFDQFGNAIWHYEVTGYTIQELFNLIKEKDQKLSAYISATGSAGTIAAGDYLREKFPSVKVVASEALQCPTLFMNGFGGHRIEGIGDKHVPWIHNVKNTDFIAAIDDEQTLRILRLFNEPAGHQWLKHLGVKTEDIKKLSWMGISSICNLLSAIKLSRYYEYNENDVIFTVFTDSTALYNSRLSELNESMGSYTERQAEVDWTGIFRYQGTDYLKELNYNEKKAIHNLKYFTWVEQQGKDVKELNAQWYDENYWRERFSIVPEWDKMITDFNNQVGIKV